MAQLIQQNRETSPKRTSFKGKDVEFDVKIINSVSANQEETERMFCRKRLDYGDEGSLFLKPTERLFPAHGMFNQVWLTQDSGQSSSKRSEWSPKMLEKDSKDGLLQAYNILEQNGLMEIFESFEVLRSYIADQMTNSTNSSSSHNGKLNNRISLYQIVAEFKAKVFQMQKKDDDDDTPEQRDHSELKDILKQLNFFRNENCKLKNKIRQICNKFDQSNRKKESSNSILDNSVTFDDDSSVLSSRNMNMSDSSIDMRLQKLKSDVIRPFQLAKEGSRIIQTFGFTEKNIFDSNSEGSDQYSSFDSGNSEKNRDYPIQEQSSYVIEGNLQKESDYNKVQQRACLWLKDQWIQALANSIKCLKDVFKKYVVSANLALMKTDFIKDLQKLLEQYKNHKPFTKKESEVDFLRESKRMMQLITDSSSSISQIISSQLLSHKKPVLKSHSSFNK